MAIKDENFVWKCVGLYMIRIQELKSIPIGYFQAYLGYNLQWSMDSRAKLARSYAFFFSALNVPLDWVNNNSEAS